MIFANTCSKSLRKLPTSEKENVKCNRLKEPDKTKYELYDILKTEVGRCGNWDVLVASLKRQGVESRQEAIARGRMRGRAARPWPPHTNAAYRACGVNAYPEFALLA